MKRYRVLIGIITTLIVVVALNYRLLTSKPLPRLQDIALVSVSTGNMNPAPRTNQDLIVDGWYSSTQLLVGQLPSNSFISIDTERGVPTPLLNNALGEAIGSMHDLLEIGKQGLDATDLTRSKPCFLKQTPLGTVVGSCIVSPDGVKTAWLTKFTPQLPLEKLLRQVFPRYHTTGKLFDGVWIANRDGSDAHLLGTVEDSGARNTGGVLVVCQTQWSQDSRRMVCSFGDTIYILQMD